MNELRGGFPLFAVMLILLGGLFLLQTTGVVPWELWGRLWRAWPALLVAAGINIVVGRRNPMLAGVLIALALAVAVGAALLISPQSDISEIGGPSASLRSEIYVSSDISAAAHIADRAVHAAAFTRSS